MSEKHEILKKYFGYDSFREGQELLIDGILTEHDALGIMPTGAGKSVCYQVPAVIFKGMTIVVSPLISLMKDQVTALNQTGIRAAYINSSLTYRQYRCALRNAEKGEYKIIYAAPERLLTDDFLSFACKADISFVSVDEAHCISHWGQDFRPSYLKIPEFIKKLPKRPMVGAFTATATREVREDIVKYLELKDPVEIITGFDRKNLFFEVQRPQNKTLAMQKIISECEGQSGIVYCSTRKNTDLVCETLNESGIKTAKYHAGMDAEERKNSQEAFIYDKVRVIAATNAFGMGIDKSNVSFVIHYNMPKNMESYYQEAGRAGRDGAPARCVLLFSESDINTARFFIENGGNGELDDDTAEAVRKNEYKRLDAMVKYCKTSECLRKYILNYFGERSVGSCKNCSNCSTEYEQIDITADAQKILSCIVRMGENYGRKKIISVLRGKSDIYKDISTYGIMSETNQAKSEQIFDYLLENDYIYQTEEMRPIVRLAPASKKVLFKGERLQMKIKKSVLNGIPEKGGNNKELFQRLREVRSKIAHAQSVPAYIVFTDSALEQMCSILPSTKEEFMRINGVGYAKCDKYGDKFMEEIRQYLMRKTNDINED